MAKLALNSRHVAGLLDDVAAHRMARTMGRPARDAGDLADIVPHIVDHLDRQAPVSVRIRARRQEKGRGLPLLKVGFPFVLDIVLDRGEPFLVDLIRVPHPAFFLDGDFFLRKVHIG